MSDLNLIAGEIASGINAFQGVRNQREAARRQSQQDARAEALFKMEQEAHKSSENLNALRMQNEALEMKFSKNQESQRNILFRQSQEDRETSSPFRARQLAAETAQSEERVNLLELQSQALQQGVDFTDATKLDNIEKVRVELETAKEDLTYRRGLSAAAAADEKLKIAQVEAVAKTSRLEKRAQAQKDTTFVLSQMRDSIAAAKEAPLDEAGFREFGETLRDNIVRTGTPDSVGHADNFFEAYMSRGPRASRENIIDDLNSAILTSTPKSQESTSKLRATMGEILVGSGSSSGGSSQGFSVTDESLPSPVKQALMDVYNSSGYLTTKEYRERKNLNVSTSLGTPAQKLNFKKVIRGLEDAQKVMTGKASARVKSNSLHRIYKKFLGTSSQKIGGKTVDVPNFGIHPDDNPKLREMFPDVIAAIQAFENEHNKTFEQKVKENTQDIEKAFGVKLK